MAETAQDVDKLIIVCVAFFMKKARGGGGVNIIGRNISVAKGEKILL